MKKVSRQDAKLAKKKGSQSFMANSIKYPTTELTEYTEDQKRNTHLR